MDIIDRVKKIALKFRSQGSISEADLDEFFFLIDAAGAQLPSQVHAIVADLRKSRPLPSNRLEQIERIFRVIQAYESLPEDLRTNRLEVSQDGDALIPKFDLIKSDRERVL
jgi:hypothetical protein